FLLSLLFLSTLPRHPTSTLFPYTTLFRSPHETYRQTVPPAPDRCRSTAVICPRCQRRSQCHRSVRRHCHGGADWPRSIGRYHLADRKSTRLNSSHVKISYAVFCLKKKKRQ